MEVFEAFFIRMYIFFSTSHSICVDSQGKHYAKLRLRLFKHPSHQSVSNGSMQPSFLLPTISIFRCVSPSLVIRLGFCTVQIVRLTACRCLPGNHLGPEFPFCTLSYLEHRFPPLAHHILASVNHSHVVIFAVTKQSVGQEPAT